MILAGCIAVPMPTQSVQAVAPEAAKRPLAEQVQQLCAVFGLPIAAAEPEQGAVQSGELVLLLSMAYHASGVAREALGAGDIAVQCYRDAGDSNSICNNSIRTD